jgi:glycosyl transferase, family 25
MPLRRNRKVPVGMFFDQDALVGAIEDFRADRSPVSFPRLFEFFGICAYSISPSGAKQMLDGCFPLKNGLYPSVGLGRTLPNAGIDTIMNGYHGSMRSYVAFPPLAISKNERATSSLQTDDRIPVTC